jgi:hypothetical protein
MVICPPIERKNALEKKIYYIILKVSQGVVVDESAYMKKG